MGDPIDYDKLAAQHGGTAVVDYDALAAQHGGTVVSEQPSVLSRAGSAISSAASTVGNEALGFVKGAGHTAQNVMASGALDGMLGPGASAIAKSNAPYAAPALEPQPGQKLGYGGEQMLEYVLPAAMTGGASALGLAGRMGVEAATTGAVAGAQTMDPKQAATAAALGATGPLIGAAAAKAAPALKASANTAMGRFLAPTTQKMKGKATKIIPEMLDRGVSGSRQAVMDQAIQGLADTGPGYQAITATQGKTPVDTQAVVQGLEKLKSKYLVPTVDGSVQPATKGAESALAMISDLQQRVATTEPTLASIRALRSILGGETEKAFGKLPAEQQVTEKIKAATYNALRTELQKASPDLAALDKEYAFWSNVKDVLGATQRRKQGQSPGLTSLLGGAATRMAGMAGLVEHSVPLFSGAVIGEGLTRLIESPAWQSWSAVRKGHLAQALAEGRLDLASSLIGRVAAGAAIQSSGGSATTQDSR